MIVKMAPWKLAKTAKEDPLAQEALDLTLAMLWRALRVSAVLVSPVMPDLAKELWGQLGLAGSPDKILLAKENLEGKTQLLLFTFDPTLSCIQVGDPKPLFARIDKEAEMNEMEAGAGAEAHRRSQSDDPKGDAQEVRSEASAAPAAPATPSLDVPALRETVDYDTFARTDLRVGKVLEAERVPKSDKLIKMKVDLGFELRTIVGGIGKAYAPEVLVGRQVVVVANLAPRKLMGIESHGMLLAASDNAGLPYLIAPADDARPGFIVK